MDFGLNGKRAFVSGATAGIGRAVADALAAEGADLFITARNAGRLAETAAQIQAAHGVRCLHVPADFGSEGQPACAARQATEAFDGIDILVNNAGRSLPATIDTPPAEWAASNQLNFLSHLEVINSLLPAMKSRGWGRMVNVMGIAYRQAMGLNMGTIAKYGLIATSKSLAKDIAKDGVTVNTVTVGLIESRQINELHYPTQESRASTADRMIPAGRFGKPEEVAAAVLFLCSRQAGYITSSTMTVDGGADVTLL